MSRARSDGRGVDDRMVVVPNHQFGSQAWSLGYLRDDESWVTVGEVRAQGIMRGRRISSWRWLADLDKVPTDLDRLDAWLERESRPLMELPDDVQREMNQALF